MYDFKPLTLDYEELSICSTLLKKTFPVTKRYNDKYLSWLYCDNPDGHAIGFNSYYKDSIGAHYATIPIEAEIYGRAEKGLLSLNTATHIEHRGKGLFTKLANHTYVSAKDQNYKFIVGVANANSTNGFIKKHGFQLVGPLKAKIGIGPISHTNSNLYV